MVSMPSALSEGAGRLFSFGDAGIVQDAGTGGTSKQIECPDYPEDAYSPAGSDRGSVQMLGLHIPDVGPERPKNQNEF